MLNNKKDELEKKDRDKGVPSNSPSIFHPLIEERLVSDEKIFLEKLVKALDDVNPKVRINAINTLGTLGEKAVPILSAAFKREVDVEVKATLIHVLSRISEKTRNFIINTINNSINNLVKAENNPIKLVFIQILGSTDKPENLESLLKLLERYEENDESINREVIRSIRKIWPTQNINLAYKTLDKLIEIFKKEKELEIKGEILNDLIDIIFLVKDKEHQNKVIEDITPYLKEYEEGGNISFTKALEKINFLKSYNFLTNEKDKLEKENAEINRQLNKLKQEILEKEKEIKTENKKKEEVNSLIKRINELEAENYNLINEIKKKEVAKVKSFEIQKITKKIKNFIMGSLLLISITEGIILFKIRGSGNNKYPDSIDSKIKSGMVTSSVLFEQKKKYENYISSYTTQLIQLNNRLRNAEETISIYESIEEMRNELNKLANQILTADPSTVKMFIKCRDAFQEVNVNTSNLKIAYCKKEGFLEAARQALKGNLKEAQKIYDKTLKIK